MNSEDINIPSDGEGFSPIGNPSAFLLDRIVIDSSPDFPDGACGIFGPKNNQTKENSSPVTPNMYDEADTFNSTRAQRLIEEANDLELQAELLEKHQMGFVNTDDLNKAERLKVEAGSRRKEAERYSKLSDAHHKRRVELDEEKRIKLKLGK